MAWDQHVIDKCFEPGAYCEKKEKRDIVMMSVESRDIEERVPLPPPVEISMHTRPYSFFRWLTSPRLAWMSRHQSTFLLRSSS